MRFSGQQIAFLLTILLLVFFAVGFFLVSKPDVSSSYHLVYGQSGQPGTRLINLETRDDFAVKDIPFRNWRVQDYPSPDARWIARWTLLVENSWWRLDLEDSVTGKIQTIGDFNPCDARAAWSPDNRMIALALITDPGDPNRMVNLASISRCGIHLYDVERGVMTRITDPAFAAFDPAFSPDGEQLVFSSSEDGFNRLYIMTLATGERRLLTPNSFGYRAAWSPDGQWIAFMSNHEDWNDDIYLIAPDGSDLQRLTSSASPDDYPQWVQAGSVAIDWDS